MKVLFDHQAFTMQTYGGVSRCFAELYSHLPQECKAIIALRESDNAYVKSWPGIHPKGYGYEHFITTRYFKGKGHLHVWCDHFRKVKYYPDYNRNYTVSLLKKSNYDVFHPTYFGDYFLPYLNGKPFVLTIHDMIPELYPQYFHRDDFQIRMKRKLAPLASAIIAVSETTKHDVVRLLNVPEEKVHVVYHGCSFPENSSRVIPHKAPYILYVGERNAYKDFNLFVNYIAPVLQKHKGLKIVCTGKPFLEKEILLLEKAGVKEQFVNHWVSTDEEFFALYHNALCFIYTSEYEGFGIPILEAYKADCPVLLNNRSCFPEIAGEAAIYFEMTQEYSDLSSKIETILGMTVEQREKLLCMQRERLSLYSWEQSARKLYEVYQSVLK